MLFSPARLRYLTARPTTGLVILDTFSYWGFLSEFQHFKRFYSYEYHAHI